MVLVVPCTVALREWWSWYGVGVCGRWYLAGLRRYGAMVRRRWWALVRVVLLVCPGGLGVGWYGVAGPETRPGCRALLEGTLTGPLTCLGLLGLVGVGGGDVPCPRRGDAERAFQRCAPLRHASRPLT